MKISKKGECEFCNSKTDSIADFLITNLGIQFQLCPYHTGRFRLFLIHIINMRNKQNTITLEL